MSPGLTQRFREGQRADLGEAYIEGSLGSLSIRLRIWDSTRKIGMFQVGS